MTDDKPKFTPGPWEVHDKTYGEHRLISVVSDSPMVIIANMPKRYDKLGDEWEKAFNIDEVAANAALIAQSPSLYANEERNLKALKTLLAYYETIDFDRHSEDCRMVANGIMSDLKDLIETTEKLLAKCRGENTDA